MCLRNINILIIAIQGIRKPSVLKKTFSFSEASQLADPKIEVTELHIPSDVTLK